MSLRVLGVLAGFALLLTACESGKPKATGPKPSPVSASASAKSEEKGAVRSYGAPLGTAPKQILSEVLNEPARFAGQPVKLEGHVRRACSKMGCWMELSTTSEPAAPACRVIFQGHRFFVPTNSAGSQARVEGTLEVRRVEADQVAHMEAEGGEFPRKATDGSAEELRFIATGVELWRS